MCPPGHVRAPYYLRGKIGEIERELGPFGNPELLAYGLEGENKTLYRVRFTMAELWGDSA
ncbi:MAG: SH3-like domain-containing protein, partial [Pseudomonadota bacterium]